MKKYHSSQGFGLLIVVILVAVIALIAGICGFAFARGGLGGVGLNPIEFFSSNGAVEVSGTVTIGPTSPVCMAGKPCSAAAANRLLEAKDTHGGIVASTKTDEHGAYTLRLKPGTYIFSLVPQAGIGSGKQVIISGPISRLDLSFDTGIR